MKNKNYHREILVAASQNLKERDYWLKKLSGELGKNNFPYDNKGKVLLSGDTQKTVQTRLTGPLSSKLLALSTGVDHTLHIILTAALVGLIEKYTGSKDIMLGTPIYKQDIKGDFFNTVLILRNQIEYDNTFKELLLQVRQTIIEAVENQDYPVEVLSDHLNLRIFENEFSLIDIFILLRNIHDKNYIRDIPYNLLFSFSRTGGNIEFIVEYNWSRYEETTIKRIIAHFKKLLQTSVFNLDSRVLDMEILSGEEKKQLLYDFNNTAAEYAKAKTISQRFEEQVGRAGDRIAVIGTGYGGRGTVQHLTYRELNRESNQLANLLREKGVQPLSIIGIMVERSIEMMVGIFGILKAGGAYLPIDTAYPGERIKYILKDSAAKWLLSRKKIAAPFDNICQLIDIEKKNRYGCEKGKLKTLTGSTHLAYVTYTSGSTGKPKGIMITNRSVINFIKGITSIIPFGENDTVLSLTTISFDIFGLETILPLTCRSKVVIGSREEQLDPGAAASVIRKEKITAFQVTPSSLQLLIQDHVAAKSLEILKYLLVGGEEFPGALLKRVRNIVPGKIYNVYGPTETTIWSTLKDVSGDESLTIGKPLANTFIYILSKTGLLQPIGIEGQLCIAGDGLARGYINRPDLTADKFVKNPFIKGKETRIYRTGDVARWLPDGDIHFIGRTDYQVKIRGLRIELGEIESQLEKHERVKHAVLLPLEREDSDKYLCAYMVADPTPSPANDPADRLDISQLREFLSKTLPDYMIPSYFMQIEKIPLTSNGKVNRKELPVPQIQIDAEYIAPGNELEEKLAEIWSDILRIEKERIGMGNNFFELGGHSFRAVIMISRIHKELGVKLPLMEFFKMPKIKDLAKHLQEAAADKYVPIENIEEREYYEVSSVQRRLYFLQQIDPTNRSYNISSFVRLEGRVDIEFLNQVFGKLIERHESLRTSFELIDGKPAQKVSREVEFNLDYYETEEGTNEFVEIIEGFNPCYDLRKPPLLRALLIKVEEKKYIMGVSFHHIIFDGFSNVIFVKELMMLYSKQELPELKFRYKDYTAWQNSKEYRELVKKQQDYWLREFMGDIPCLELPTDYPRSGLKSFEGDRVNFIIDRKEAAALKKMALNEGATLYMVMLAIYNIFLFKLSGQEDIIVGTSAAGRGREDLQYIIGMFVNAVSLRNFPSGDKTFNEFFKEVKNRTIEAFDNQDFQFEDLVDKVVETRKPGRSPIFDIMFVFDNEDPGIIDIPKIKLFPYESKLEAAQFDLKLRLMESDDTILASIEYSTNLFSRETITKYINNFKEIVLAVSEDGDVELRDITISYDLVDARSEIPSINFEF